ncbi:putative SNARE associated golgi family protein [Helianthus debilis subsp. tardiflorus]
MTYEETDAVTVLKIAIEDPRDDYVILSEPEVLDAGGGGGGSGGGCCSGGGGGFWYCLWWWLKLVLVVLFLAVLGVCFFLWIGPFLMNKEVIPILNWETETFCKPVLALLIFATVALFPTIFLPSTPSMWVAGMRFGYGFGFLLIIGGVTIGVSLPYFLGSLFYHKIQGWLERYPKKASILKLAGEGNWFNQFRAVTLLRISPFPYIVYNYCAVATDVKFGPYLLGTLLGMIPEIFVAIYTGIMIRTLADASNDHQSLSAPQIICTVFGFLLTIATTVVVTVYAKRRLSELQKDEEQLLLQ